MKNDTKESVWFVVLIALGVFVLFEVAATALDINVDNHNRMLCESAKVSGNIIYLTKCAPYYKNGDIIQLREVLR